MFTLQMKHAEALLHMRRLNTLTDHFIKSNVQLLASQLVTWQQLDAFRRVDAEKTG